jgi:hypothetical protein
VTMSLKYEPTSEPVVLFLSPSKPKGPNTGQTILVKARLASTTPLDHVVPTTWLCLTRGWPTIRKLSCWVRGTHMSTLERETARAHQTDEPKQTETELENLRPLRPETQGGLAWRVSGYGSRVEGYRRGTPSSSGSVYLNPKP